MLTLGAHAPDHLPRPPAPPPRYCPCRVSDPDHADFNKLLTNEEVNAMVAPAAESVEAVRAFLRAHGVSLAHDVTASPNFDLVTVNTTVRVAEAMLDASYHHYEHAAAGLRVMRLAGPYSLPAEVAAHVDFVGPSVRFPTPRVVSKADVMAHASDITNTPQSLRALYNVGSTEGSAPGNLQSCAAFLKQYYAASDLKSFFSKFYTPAVGRTPTVIGPNTGGAGIEASLDIEYIMAMGGGVPTIFWSTAGQQPHNPQNEPFLVWLQAMASTPDAKQPKTCSQSYGDNEGGVNMAYAVRVNAEFQKAGVRGVSLMFSSGDGGVGGSQSTPCTTFIPTFPAGSPWVTAVGGTSNDPETAAGLSSGGFSNYWARPAWQAAAVSGYMSSGVQLPDASRYNHTGAGFPDVAAQATGFSVVWNGMTVPVAGTSCSSPTFTGIMSLVNDARMAAGKKPLGFLNQVIYKNGDAFNDITSGNNPGCGTSGYQATKGWDPVTGFGTPDFAKLKNIGLSLP